MSPNTDAMPDLNSAGAFVRGTGLVIGDATGTRVSGHVDLGPDHHTPWGVVHGGLYTTVIESAASIGASAAVIERGEFAVGINNSTDFLRSMREGRAEVLAVPVFQGRTQQLWQVTVARHADGKEIARGNVRLQNVPLPG